jgi:hypothetical protein
VAKQGAGRVTTWAVDSSTLQFYLSFFVQPGDTVALAPGTYSGQAFANLSFVGNGGVTITSADPNNHAVLTDFAVTGSTGLTFSNLELATNSPVGTAAFVVKSSNDIHFDNVKVHGSPDATGNDANGLEIDHSTNVSVTNSEFQQLGHGAAISTSSGIVLAGNNVHDMQSDGFDFAQVDHLTIAGNVFTDFHPVAGAHPDAMQFFTNGTTAASHDITISGNVILLGQGQQFQGIFMTDSSGVMPYENVTISDNLINSSGSNAIRLSNVHDLTLDSNELISPPEKIHLTYILIQNSDHVTSLNNDAVTISFDHVTNLSETGDTLNKPTGDNGVAIMQAFSLAHPDVGLLLAPYIPAPEAPPPMPSIGTLPDISMIVPTPMSMFPMDFSML